MFNFTCSVCGNEYEYQGNDLVLAVPYRKQNCQFKIEKWAAKVIDDELHNFICRDCALLLFDKFVGIN